MKGDSSDQRKGKAVSVDREIEEVRVEIENQREPTQKIYKVRTHVKDRNLTAYQPKLVSIGPYHYGVPQLGRMEMDKRRAQDKLVKIFKVTIDDCKLEMKKIVKTLKKCYADLDHVEWSDDDKFVDLMILDGCFLIAFFFEPLSFFENYPANDPIFSKRGHAISYDAVMRDLLMAENQLPYLALDNFLTTSGKNSDTISQWIRPGVKERGFHMLETYMGGLLELGVQSTQHRTVGMCASELHQFNVQFRKAENYTSMQFSTITGILNLPVLIINEHITSTYLNMNAQALTQTSSTANVFTIYACLMGTLVKSSKDVKLLEYHGIIINQLRNYEDVVEVIQEIAKGTFVSEDVTDGDGLSYKSMQEDIDKFCQKRCIKLKKTIGFWLSELYETHFKNPWTGLSLLAAIVLLALTAAQTYYAIQSYNYAALSYSKQQ